MRKPLGIFAVALFGCLVTSCLAAQSANHYHLGVVGEAIPNFGYRVESVVPESAATRMVALDDGATYFLEKDDVIRGLGGNAIDSREDLLRAIWETRSRHGRSSLTIFDSKTQSERQFKIQLKKLDPAASYTLGITPAQGENGIIVSAMDPNGPAANMWTRQMPKAWLDPGDEILSVNGFATENAQMLRAAIQTVASNDGVGTLRFKNNKQGGVVEEFSFRADRQVAPRVHYLIIGQTAEPNKNFNKMVELSLSDMDNMLGMLGPEMVGSARFVDGRQCTAGNIRKALNEINPAPQDAVFVYMLVHGAYDQKGQFFQLSATQAEENDSTAGQDLYRSEIRNALAKMGARLTVFITESCNSEGEFQKPDRVFTSSGGVTVNNLTLLEDLFLNYRGVIETNSAAKDQLGWGNDHYGGFFTYNLANQATNLGADSNGWQEFMEKIAQGTGLTYQQSRQGAIKAGRPQAMIDQLQLTPISFQFQVAREESGIRPGYQRTLRYVPRNKR